MKFDFDKYLIDPERAKFQAMDITREAIAQATKKVAELNEKTAEQVIIVELERRLANVEAERDHWRSQCDNIPEGCTPTDARVLREANHKLADELEKVRNKFKTYKEVKERLSPWPTSTESEQ